MIRFSALWTLMAGVPLLATAQSGTVRYDEATRLDIELPPGMARNPAFMANLPKSTVRPVQLQFTEEASSFTQVRNAPEEGRVIAGGEFRTMGGDAVMIREITPEMMQMGRAMGFVGGGASASVAGAFTNLADDSYVEVREFLGRTFRIPTERPTFAWKLTGEAASFLGHPVYQAVAQQDSTTLEAWFTPDIPVSAGPAQYGGLPGLILTLAVDSNRVVYTATAIDLETPVEKITAPKDGSEVTREEYDKIVAEKQAEMARSRRGRRNN
ncbi:MAG: GLPGLI family protein [Gemmatimonadales bacterium]